MNRIQLILIVVIALIRINIITFHKTFTSIIFHYKRTLNN